MNVIRIAYWIIVIMLGVWSVIATSRPTVPTAAQDLDVNHKIKPGDLQTPQIADLMNHYLRKAVKPGAPVTSDMVGEKAGVPVIESGFAVIVNVSRALREQRNIHEGDVVRIKSGDQLLGDPGVVQAVTCDESRCAIAIGLDKAPHFEPKALQGAEVEEFHPATSDAASMGI